MTTPSASWGSQLACARRPVLHRLAAFASVGRAGAWTSGPRRGCRVMSGELAGWRRSLVALARGRVIEVRARWGRSGPGHATFNNR